MGDKDSSDSAYAADIPVQGSADRTIVKWLVNFLRKKLYGEQLYAYLRDNWSMDDFFNIESHRNKKFFDELRNTLRDYGVPCYNSTMAKSMSIGLKILLFIWQDLPEDKIKDFKESAAMAKRERGSTPSNSATPSRSASPTRGLSREQHLDKAPIETLTRGLHQLLGQLERSYAIGSSQGQIGKPPTGDNRAARIHSQDYRVNPGSDTPKVQGNLPATTDERSNSNAQDKPLVNINYNAHTNDDGGDDRDGNEEANCKAYSPEEYRLQQATRQILDYCNKLPQFAGSIDNDWPRHLRQFLAVCQAYRTNDSDHAKLFVHSLTPASASHQLLESLQDAGVYDWRAIVDVFDARFFNEATRERVLNKINKLNIENYRQQDDKDDNNALKRLITDLDKMCGMVLHEDRTPEARKRYLHSAILGTEWGHHARAKIRSTEDFGETIAILHEAIDYLANLKSKSNAQSPRTSTSKSSAILLVDMHSDDDTKDTESQANMIDDDDVLFQRMFTHHPRTARYKQFGRNNGRPQYGGRSHTFNHSGRPQLGCFNCLKLNCHVNRCPLPKDPNRIRSNLATWKSLRGERSANSGIHLSDLHLYSHEEVYEINVAESVCAELPPNPPPQLQDTLLTQLAQHPQTASALNYGLTPSPLNAHAYNQTPTPHGINLSSNAQHQTVNPYLHTEFIPLNTDGQTSLFTATDYDDIGFSLASTVFETTITQSENPNP